ncbi:AsmA family protein [Salinarimonas ramus]|uniref:Cell envelope biogenesis protein AsmA n=1 Tax=Salinarimonas ramus TaxID=690164 RepID=A0A917QA96_9HYPH|nr:AsmA family protein [Salinarimonas ramus]GGK38628.1 cell envelope biogenesis protein AsmA [Salinarimonas ramus]
MRRQTSLRTRVIAGLVGACVVVGLVLAVAPWTVSSDALREAVARQLARELGIDMPVTGRTTIAFLPAPRVKFEDMRLATTDGTPLVDGGALRGQLAWAPLVLGRIRLTEVSLAQARVLVPVDAQGRSPWDPALARLDARLADDEGDAIGTLGLVDTTIVYSDAATGRREIVRDADLVLSWPNAAGPLSLSGSAALRGETMQIALSGLVPAQLVAGASSPLDLRLTGRLGRLSIAGTIATGRDSPWLTGRVSFETRMARDVLAWSGTRLPLGPSIGPLSLEGDANGVGRTLSFSALRLGLGGDPMEGALTARYQDGRLGISGTLAAGSLDVDRFAAPVVVASDPASSQRRAPLGLTQHAAADLDLRLSASEARIGGARLTDVAMAVLVTKGKIETSVSRAGLAGGEVRGRFTLSDLGDMIEMRLEAEGSGVDLGPLGRDLGSAWIAGPATGEIALVGTGRHAEELLGTLAGEVAVEVAPGEFVGVDLAEALRRFERQPLTATRTLRSGRTPFTRAAARLDVLDGVGTLVDSGFESPQLSGMLEGTVSLAARRIDAKAAVESVTPVGEGNLISALTFGFRGPLTDVTLVPDAKALIQRSGAARLLLGAPEPETETALPAFAPAAQQ